MPRIYLIKIKSADEKYFARWWRDRELLKLTSGDLRLISDEAVEKYFVSMFKSEFDYHFMIILDKKVIGHIALAKRKNNWYETQIIIGDKKQWGKGYGTKAIKVLIQKASKLGIKNIYLEVRPDNLRAIRAYEKCDFVSAGLKNYPNNKYLKQTLKMVKK